VELGGFESPTPSLRKMWSNHCDQEERGSVQTLWGGCGAREVPWKLSVDGEVE
jgi:hypothetical protein